MNNQLKKIVIVGDSLSGKSAMWISYYKNQYRPDCYIPTVFDTHSDDTNLQGKKIQFILFDTAGQEDYKDLRIGTYPDTDVVLLCLPIDSQTCLKTIKDKWIVEIRQYCPNAPVILIGTKIDLRNDGNISFQSAEEKITLIKPAEGLKLARKIKALAYMECSAKTKEGLADVFMAAMSATQKGKHGKSRLI